MKWPLMLLLLCSLPSFVSANTNALGQAGTTDCDGTCSQGQAAGGEGVGVMVAALGPIAETVGLTDDQNERLCGMARSESWETISSYISRQSYSIEDALQHANCTLAKETNQSRSGNIFHVATRYSGYVSDIIRYASRYLLRDNSHKNIFKGLILGVNGQDNIFKELVGSWNELPNSRNDIEIAARTICLSIDRYKVDDLISIRNNECKTEPFVF